MACSKDEGIVRIDGSSTVFPITSAVGAQFQKAELTKVAVGVSGTIGGFRKFCAGETDISGASRPITTSESALCHQNGVEYIEVPIGHDGLSVLVNPRNDWARDITVTELKKMWEPPARGTVKRRSLIRAGWPDRELHLYGAGVDSGTYDYFTEAIVGTQHSSRSDFKSSEDDDVLVKDIVGDELGLGFFDFLRGHTATSIATPTHPELSRAALAGVFLLHTIWGTASGAGFRGRTRTCPTSSRPVTASRPTPSGQVGLYFAGHDRSQARSCGGRECGGWRAVIRGRFGHAIHQGFRPRRSPLRLARP
ncbi:MAG: substrate-binding domain-containing protein [Pseudomonadota bacterium]